MKKLLVFICFFYCLLPIYAQKKMYVVQAGDNLYKIASRFDMTLNRLKEVNQFANDKLKEGQKIWVEGAKTELITAKTAPKITIKREEGMGEMIDSKDTSVKLALHRTAEIGTVLRVVYEGKKTSTRVKVIGKIPDIDADKNVIIKLSRAACIELGILNERFPVIVYSE
ncbi:MAG: LysM peptidoglycan-binding domain-containing protein [Bacteroidetes bacterium]|nr:MAG: LysM peptidoglycan-binding domain-containing protein [Bacteroidota bacterium]